ncbi:MAG: hypothetical protein A2583_00835 [Bdellovibrionales bacterium RIFOXYD1_FULL_53_11]|nr:MAG: hypothetical protein A2583_00835 [Bdellovibrionales bacterium RIFOXYD1_FULL_53_11]
MKINGNEILERLAAARMQDRDKTTLYLSKGLYSEFKRICGQIPASTVMEELMKEFIRSTPKRGGQAWKGKP